MNVVRFDEDALIEGDHFEGLCRCGKGISGLHVHTADGYQIVCPGDLIVDGSSVYHLVETRT